jgi:tetratricopeptide (TPR) repeat protein
MSSRGPAARTAAVLLAIALVLVTPTAVVAQGRAGAPARPAALWVGRRVVAKSRAVVLRDGSGEIEVDGYYRYRIRQVAGRRLLLEAEGLGVVGWAGADRFIPVEEALAYFTDRIRTDPRDAFAYVMRAIAWGEKKVFDREVTDLTRAAALESGNPDIYLLRGRARFERGEYDAAIADGDRAIRLDAANDRARQLRGVARCRKQDFGGAIADLSRAILSHPRSADGYVNRGFAWFESGNYTRAILDLTTAIRLDPENPSAYGDRGMAWCYKGRYDSAIVDFDRAIALDPKDALLYARRSYAWLNLGKLDAALADSDRAVRLGPDRPEAHVARGNAWLRRGAPDAALADFDEALRLDPRNAMARFGRGDARESREDDAGALADYDEAARLDPTMAIAHNNAARLRATCPDARLRDGEKAVASATRACDLTNWRVPALIDTLAASYAAAGDVDAAIKWQTRAIALLPDGPEKSDGEARLKLYRARTPYHRPNP